MKLLTSIICLAVFSIGIFAQEKPVGTVITEDEFNKILSPANEKSDTGHIYASSTTKTYLNGKLIKTDTYQRRYHSPNRYWSMDTFQETDGSVSRLEIIRMGQRSYQKQDNGVWKKKNLPAAMMVVADTGHRKEIKREYRRSAISEDGKPYVVLVREVIYQSRGETRSLTDTSWVDSAGVCVKFRERARTEFADGKVEEFEETVQYGAKEGVIKAPKLGKK